MNHARATPSRLFRAFFIAGYFATAACNQSPSPRPPDGALRHLHFIRPAQAGGPYVIANRVARAELPGAPVAMTVAGQIVYAYLNRFGMATLDLSNRAAPRVTSKERGLLSHYTEQLAARSAALMPATASSKAGATDQLIDDGAMTLPGQLTPAADEHAYYAGLLESSRLFVVDRQQRSVVCFDASNPLVPRRTWECRLPIAAGRDGPVGISHAPRGYYVSCASSGLYFLPDGFTSTTQPRAVLADFDSIKQTEPFGKSYLLLANGYDGGFTVLEDHGAGDTKLRVRLTAQHFIDSLILFEGFALVSDRQRGALLIDLSDPASPYIDSLYSMRGFEFITCMARWGEHRAVIGFNTGSFDVLDLADPRAPVLLGRVAASSMIRSLAVQGDDIYAGLMIPPAPNSGRPTYQLEIFRLEERTSPPPDEAARARMAREKARLDEAR